MKLDGEQVGRVACVVGVFVFGWVLLRTAWLCDDAFISFRVVENAVAGLGLRWNTAERVQVFTHPLWMLLHIPFRAVTGEIYYTSLALCAMASLGAVGLLARRVASTTHAGVLTLALVVSSKAFVDYSTSGLENPLTHLLLVAFLVVSFRDTPTDRTFPAQALLAGLITFNRLDALILVAPVLVFSARRLGISRAWKPLLAGFGPPALWLAFATVYYGYPFPNTALAKLGAGTGLAEMIHLGARYFVASFKADPWTLLTVLGALVIAAVRRRHGAIALGVALYLLYVLRIGGDFMSGRFFSAPFVLSLAIVAREVSRRPRALGLALAAAIVVLGLLPAGSPLTSGPAFGRDKQVLIDPYGIADERAYYFRRSGLWNGTATTLPRDNKWLEATTARACGFPLVLAGAIGFYGYDAGPTVHILDFNALADPVLSRLPAVDEDRLYIDWYRRLEGREPATRRRIGHFLRNVPRGYVSFLLGAEAVFDSDEMRRHIETVTKAVRDPIRSGARINAVTELALGRTTTGFDGPAFKEYRAIPVEEVLAAEAHPVFTATIRGCTTMNSDPVGAAVALREAIAGCPANGQAWMCLAGAARLTGAAGEALYAQGKLAELAPEADWIQLEYGRALLVGGQPARAIEAFERAIELNRWNTDAIRGLAAARAEAARLAG